MKNYKFNNFSIVLASFLFAVGGVNIANADQIIGTNTPTGPVSSNPFIGVDSIGNLLTTGASVTISGTSTDGIVFDPRRDAYGGYVNGVANSNIYGNTINIEKANIQVNSGRIIAAGRAANNGSDGSIVQENKLIIKDSNITIGGEGIYPSVIGGRVDRTGGEAKNNTVEISNSDVTYYIYGGKGSNHADNNSTIYNNHVYIKDSKFGSIWGGQAQAATDDKNHAKYNTIIIVGGGYSQKAKSGDLRGGTTYGAGDSEYNTLFISGGTTLDRNSVSIFGGYSQGNAKGNNRYNQLILDNVKIPTASDTIYAGGIKSQDQYDKSNTEAVGNRAYINDLKFAKGIVVGGGSELGNTSDNIVVINGTTELKSAYGGEVREGADGTAKDNLVIMSGGTINENIYGGYTQGGETSGNAVYFMGGEVSGIVGGGNNGNENTLILGNSTSDFGTRKAGQISNFNALQFNAVKDGTNADAVLTLTDSANGADLNGVAINFINKDAIDGAVEVVVGGNSGTGVNEKRNNGGGANAITELTKNAIKYGANLDKIAVVVSGAEAKNDIIENLERTLSDGTKDPQATYGIGDTFDYKYETIDLTQPNKKYYLIKSNAALTNYENVDIDWQNKAHSGETLKNGAKIVDASQTDQIYKIKNSTIYTRNLAGMFVSSDEKDLYITGANEVEETWSNDKFDTDEFTKFGKPDNKDNQIYIEANTGDLNSKIVYGGYSDSGDSTKNSVENNNIYLNQNANLSNATIIGGYSKSGKVSNNTVDLNNTSVTADITLAQTDNGSIDIATNKLIKADNQTITGSLTVAKSDSANLENATYTMPENIEITGDFILADTQSGNISNNTLDVTNVKATNIYVGKSSSGEASNNTINIKGDKVDGNIYVGYSQSKATNNNIANFEKGEVTGTIYGGNNGTGNTLNVKDTKLKAGNVASFNIMNFTGNIASTTDVASSALILSSANDDTNLDGVEIWLNGNKYSSNSDYGLSANQKYYLIAHENKANVNYKKLANYAYRAVEKTIGDGSVAIDVTQSDQNYRIIDSQTYTRNLRGMFADATVQKNIYIIANSEIKENIGSSIGDDVFEKFGKSKTGNTVTIDPDDKNSDLDLSNTAIGGSDSTGNTLNVGKDNTNPIKMNKIKISNVTNFDTINMYLPDPKPNETVIEIKDGSNTDVSKSNINVFINDVSKFTSGRIHLLKADNGQVISSNPGTVKVKAQIGAIATAETNSLDLVYKGGSGGTSTNDQTKIFSEARLGALGALWQGQYLIANHLDRVIPDAFSELFPYAITESYDKRFNTGSHVDTRGFNANAGFASKGTNSSGEFTMGPFLDYGFSNYDAYLDDGTHGDGKNYYIGGGFFGKQENNSGSYFEATFRIGQLVTEFNGDLTLNGVRENYDFDLKSTYYAFHAGLGKVYDLNANNNLDIYGRFFYTHIESADTTLNGTKTEFDAVQSKKIRLGFKDDYKFNENHAIYAGAAYEYEFDSKAGGRVLVLGSNAEMKQPSLRGSTGIGEIGYQYKKDETLKFDVGVKGYVGKQEGVSAQMAISIAF